MVKTEEAKLKVIEEFLPEQMGGGEIGKLVDQVISQSAEKEFGQVMKAVMGKVKGQADGKMVSEMVKSKLEGD